MHQAMSLSDWRKSGGAREYGAPHPVGGAAATDEGVGQAHLHMTGYYLCSVPADEAVGQVVRTAVMAPGVACVVAADEGVGQAYLHHTTYYPSCG